MTPRDLSHAQWRKSSRSSANGQCLEVAGLEAGIALRDSKDADGPVLVFGRTTWLTFVAATQAGAWSPKA